MRPIRCHVILAPLAAVFLIGSILALPAAAQEKATADVATLEVRLEVPSNADLPPQLIATVRDQDGRVIPGVVVDFTRELVFLGTTRLAVLGTATTDLSGNARLVVIPRQAEATVIATARGTKVKATLDVTYPAERTVPFFDPDHDSGLLTPLREIMPLLISTVVALLWLFVIGLVVWTFRRIRELAEGEEGQVA